MKATRVKVFAILSEERDHQDAERAKGRFNDDEHSLTSEIVLLQSYARKAGDTYTDTKGDEAALHVVRKLAAIAVRCMEHNGALSRDESESEQSQIG